jgi:hypothetical protein
MFGGGLAALGVEEPGVHPNTAQQMPAAQELAARGMSRAANAQVDAIAAANAAAAAAEGEHAQQQQLPQLGGGVFEHGALDLARLLQIALQQPGIDLSALLDPAATLQQAAPIAAASPAVAAAAAAQGGRSDSGHQGAHALRSLRTQQQQQQQDVMPYQGHGDAAHAHPDPAADAGAFDGAADAGAGYQHGTYSQMQRTAQEWARQFVQQQQVRCCGTANINIQMLRAGDTSEPLNGCVCVVASAFATS